MKLYNSLPPEARQSLVEKKLAPLLDHVPKERAKKVMKSANVLQSRYSDIPILDLKAKKREINCLLDELSRDSKRAIVRERSNREELLAEIVDSMVNWLNDIWTVVYEYNVLFEEAHACLLFIAEVLNTIKTVPGIGGCFAHLRTNLSIRRRGKIVKTFTLAGPRNIDRALLWIWRDLFVSLLAKGKNTEKVPEMLSDIEECLDWQALERMLYGGSRPRSPLDDMDDEDDEYQLEAFMDETCLEDESSDEEDEDEDESAWRCPCPLHASHWSETINEQRTELRDLVYEHLLTLFELTPSHEIFTSIISISPHSGETETQLLDTLSQIAGSSADTLVAALNIHSAEGNPDALMTLLDQHAYLLRPRDAPVLQRAVGFLADLGAFHARALQIAEKELLDTIAAVRAAVRAAFCRVEDKATVAALAEITKLRAESSQRRQRVDAWVDSVVTPGMTAPHPMAFAAMIMGFPFAPGMEDGDDMDMLAYLDVDQRDPDLEDLREEFRPKLRDRFDGWVSAVLMMKGGSGVLGSLYLKIMEEMPYFKLNDVAEEMLSRLSERTSKAHVADVVDSVLSFAKMQRKRMAARQEKRRKNEARKAASRSGPSARVPPAPAPAPAPAPLPPHITQHSAFPFSYLTTSHPVGSAAGPSSSPFPAGIGGMEDVD
ncbi:hypothetical protein B0H11DRAFT_2234915 [Mycena galericulata]|nr:hypothetical protein B0H11DRAFT_2234915 [Mycena galericulata]